MEIGRSDARVEERAGAVQEGAAIRIGVVPEFSEASDQAGVGSSDVHERGDARAGAAR